MLIDTHKAVRDLAGESVFTEQQAEKIVDVVTRADDKVATKKDLERAKFQIIVSVTGLVGALLAIFEFLI